MEKTLIKDSMGTQFELLEQYTSFRESFNTSITNLIIQYDLINNQMNGRREKLLKILIL